MLGTVAVLATVLTILRFTASEHRTSANPKHRGRLALYVLGWLTWGIVSITTLTAVYNFNPAIALATGSLASFGVILFLTNHISLPKTMSVLRASLAALSLFLILDFGVAFLSHPTTLQVDLGPTQQPVLAAASSGAPGTLNINALREGLLTSGLGQSDRVLHLDFHGFIRVTKPNFHQVVTLIIHGRFGSSRTQYLLFRARGVPQPGGSLTVISSQLTLHSDSPHLTTKGHASAVLADAVFGTLLLHRHAYTYLLTYEPTGLFLISGTISLWPRSPTVGHAALE
jgi:hypothetical protein